MPEQIIDTYLGRYKLKLSSEFAIDSYYLDKGRWEDHLRAYIQYFVKPGDICVDIGANVGFHTVTMAHSCGSDGKVYAFEPATVTFPRLVDNINLNPELKKLVVPEKMGLSSTSGMLKLYASGDLLGNCYMGEEYNEKLWNRGTPEDFELCIVTTLDEYLPAAVPVSFMKIDVEGMELDVLRGAERILRQHKPIVVYETLMEAFDIKGIQACEDFLKELGYYFFALDLQCGKLRPVRVPHVPEDTLAIHRSQIAKFGDILFNAARYMVAPGGAGAFPELEYTIVGLDNDEFSVAVRQVDQAEAEVCQADFDAGTLLVTTTHNLLQSRIELELFDRRGGLDLQCLPLVHGKAKRDGMTVDLVGTLKGGNLRYVSRSN